MDKIVSVDVVAVQRLNADVENAKEKIRFGI